MLSRMFKKGKRLEVKVQTSLNTQLSINKVFVVNY